MIDYTIVLYETRIESIRHGNKVFILSSCVR